MSAPIFRDPVFDGAADPTVVRNPRTGEWVMLYTNRRATLGGEDVAWIHGCAIGVAISKDGLTWAYRGTVDGLDLPEETGLNTHWAPEIVEVDGTWHMFLSFIPGAPRQFAGVHRNIRHYTSADLVRWTFQQQLHLNSDFVIDACVALCPDGLYRLWYKDEANGSGTFVASTPNLLDWSDEGCVIAGKPVGLPHEGPNVFVLGGQYWMIVDEWHGQGVFASPDARTWTRQGRILEDAGTHPDDRRYARHADVVVTGQEEAVLFYFTHPYWDEQASAAPVTVDECRTAIHVARVWVSNGQLFADRNTAPLRLP